MKYYFLMFILLCSCNTLKFKKSTCSNVNFDNIDNCTLLKLLKISYKKSRKGNINEKNCFNKIVTLISKKTNTLPNAHTFNDNMYIYLNDSLFYSDYNKWKLLLCD